MEPNKQEVADINLNTPEMTERLAGGRIFKKTARVEARVVTEPTPITTTLADGTVETKNTAQPGEVVVTNPGGEQYVLSAEKFAKRYSETDTPGVYQARGMIRAIQNMSGGSIRIVAPWGEEQIGGPDAWMATQFDPENPDLIGDDRYLIGDAELKETYAPAETTESE